MFQPIGDSTRIQDQSYFFNSLDIFFNHLHRGVLWKMEVKLIPAEWYVQGHISGWHSG